MNKQRLVGIKVFTFIYFLLGIMFVVMLFWHQEALAIIAIPGFINLGIQLYKREPTVYRDAFVFAFIVGGSGLFSLALWTIQKDTFGMNTPMAKKLLTIGIGSVIFSVITFLYFFRSDIREQFK